MLALLSQVSNKQRKGELVQQVPGNVGWSEQMVLFRVGFYNNLTRMDDRIDRIDQVPDEVWTPPSSSW